MPPTTLNPALGQPSLTGNTDTRGVPLAFSLPRGSGRSASRCPAPTRDERPSGVGASAPFGAAISSAPCRAYVGKRNRCSRSASGMSSLDVGRERRLSFVGSVHCAGKTVLVMREMLPAGRSTNRDTPHQPSEPGRADLPLRRTADKVHDMRQRRPPPHGTRGGRGRRLPGPDAGQYPQSSDEKRRRAFPRHARRCAGRGAFRISSGDRQSKGRLLCRVVFSSSLIKRVWGRMGGLGGREPLYAPAKGVPFPPAGHGPRRSGGLWPVTCDGGHREGR